MKIKLRLDLPIPPTGNLYWRHWRGRVVVSPVARAYREMVRLKVVQLGGRPLEGPCRVEFHVWRARRVGDLDNYGKVLLDALRGSAFEDDSQVVELHAYRHDDKARPRAEIIVETLDPPSDT